MIKPNSASPRQTYRDRERERERENVSNYRKLTERAIRSTLFRGADLP